MTEITEKISSRMDNLRNPSDFLSPSEKLTQDFQILLWDYAHILVSNHINEPTQNKLNVSMTTSKSVGKYWFKNS